MYDELELDTLGDRKTALFVIMSDTDEHLQFSDFHDATPSFSICSVTRRTMCTAAELPVHVRCLIWTSVPTSARFRSWKSWLPPSEAVRFRLAIVLQSQSQLKAIYKDNADTIIGNM